MFAPSEQLYLPLVIIDVSNQRSVRAQAKRSKAAPSAPNAGPSSRSSRVERASLLAASVRTDIVRLIPGQTRLPFEPAAR
jgi:hypothetical protein